MDNTQSIQLETSVQYQIIMFSNATNDCLGTSDNGATHFWYTVQECVTKHKKKDKTSENSSTVFFFFFTDFAREDSQSNPFFDT